MRLHGIVSLLLAWGLRVLGSTWRITSVFGKDCGGNDFSSLLTEQPVVFAFFHGQQLPMIFAHRDRQLLGMASKSEDGELLSRCIQRLGYRVVRGSSSRGGAQALRQTVRLVRESGLSPCIAVDGPRGPRHQPHPGAVGIARLSKLPVVMVVAEVSRAWRLSSWDHFLIPKPFARIELRYERFGALTEDTTTQDATEALGVEMRRMLLLKA